MSYRGDKRRGSQLPLRHYAATPATGRVRPLQPVAAIVRASSGSFDALRCTCCHRCRSAWVHGRDRGSASWPRRRSTRSTRSTLAWRTASRTAPALRAHRCKSPTRTFDARQRRTRMQVGASCRRTRSVPRRTSRAPLRTPCARRCMPSCKSRVSAQRDACGRCNLNANGHDRCMRTGRGRTSTVRHRARCLLHEEWKAGTHGRESARMSLSSVTRHLLSLRPTRSSNLPIGPLPGERRKRTVKTRRNPSGR